MVVGSTENEDIMPRNYFSSKVSINHIKTGTNHLSHLLVNKYYSLWPFIQLLILYNLLLYNTSVQIRDTYVNIIYLL